MFKKEEAAARVKAMNMAWNDMVTCTVWFDLGSHDFFVSLGEAPPKGRAVQFIQTFHP